MTDLKHHTVSSDRTTGQSSTPLGAQQLAELLTAIAADDRDAFTRFYRATHPRVFGLSLRIVRQRAAAEEVTQEVYLQVWKSAGQYDARLASPLGWLLMLTHRRSVDHVRVEARASTRDIAYGVRDLSRDHDVVAEAVGQRCEEQALAEGLRTLTTRQRETLALAFYGGRSYAEVADYLGLPLPTVKDRIRKGLQRLRSCLV
ncbi:sigma-70 family RNA polymerase sigma factor [Nocardia sp. NPDC048505]|uniref:sigma-70 family RNA polymerase sigma factor n=1 Tax=Nocardia sp. NPDC048505 TaxID=3155756 RepID=UPI0033C2FB3B